MEEPFAIDKVKGVLHRPDSPNGNALALTHGAGSNCNSPLLVRLAAGWAERGYLVLRYDLVFRQEGKTPNPTGAVRDREGIANALEALRQMSTGQVIAAGHSYGGRQSAMTAAERPGAADRLLLLSYPLHPPRKPEQKRTQYFPDLRTPALFVHGTRDPYGSVEALREAIALIPARTDVLVVERAGHDLKRAADLVEEIEARVRALT